MRVATSLSKYAHRDTTLAIHRRAVTKVIAHLKSNLGEEHTLKDMAEVAVLSAFHFNRVFREITGLPPMRYLYALRLAEAERLILTTRQKIIDICYFVGYNSLGSFNNRFVELVGFSPRCIRNVAAKVTASELRRYVDALPVPKAVNPRAPCSIWGRVDVPAGFSGIVMVAIFSGPPSNAYPIATVISHRGTYVIPPISQAGDYFAMAVGLSWHDQMVDFLLQPHCLRATMPPIYLSVDGLSSRIDFHLEPRQVIDPPLPPALVFRIVEQFMRTSVDQQVRPTWLQSALGEVARNEPKRQLETAI